MNVLATALFPLGAVAIAIGFAAHVGHAVMLANGRRSLALALGGAQPAWTGAVTGTFATARLAAVGSDHADAPLGIAPTPLGRAAAAITAIGFALLLGYLIVRGITVGGGPRGTIFGFPAPFPAWLTAA